MLSINTVLKRYQQKTNDKLPVLKIGMILQACPKLFITDNIVNSKKIAITSAKGFCLNNSLSVAGLKPNKIIAIQSRKNTAE